MNSDRTETPATLLQIPNHPVGNHQSNCSQIGDLGIDLNQFETNPSNPVEPSAPGGPTANHCNIPSSKLDPNIQKIPIISTTNQSVMFNPNSASSIAPSGTVNSDPQVCSSSSSQPQQSCNLGQPMTTMASHATTGNTLTSGPQLHQPYANDCYQNNPHSMPQQPNSYGQNHAPQSFQPSQHNSAPVQNGAPYQNSQVPTNQQPYSNGQGYNGNQYRPPVQQSAQQQASSMMIGYSQPAAQPSNQLGQPLSFGRQQILANLQLPNLHIQPNQLNPGGRPVVATIPEYIATLVKDYRMLEWVFIASFLFSFLVLLLGGASSIMSRTIPKEIMMKDDVPRDDTTAATASTDESHISHDVIKTQLAGFRLPLWFYLTTISGALLSTLLSTLGVVMLRYPEVKWPGSPQIAVRWTRIEFLADCALGMVCSLLIAAVLGFWSSKLYFATDLIFGVTGYRLLMDAQDDSDLHWNLKALFALNTMGAVLAMLNVLTIVLTIILWCTFLLHPPLPQAKKPPPPAVPQPGVMMMTQSQQQQQR